VFCGRGPAPRLHLLTPQTSDIVRPEEGVGMSDAPKNPGLDGRAREKSGQIEHKHPTTKIKHLREHYGAHFAPGWDGDSTLGELLKESKFESLTQYVKHHGHHSETQAG
jgi:hypothetical protein